MEAKTIEQAVQSKYASLAKGGLSSGHEGVRAVAEAFGWEFPPINSTEGPASDKLFVLPLGWWPLNQSELILLKSDSNVDFDFSSRFSH